MVPVMLFSCHWLESVLQDGADSVHISRDAVPNCQEDIDRIMDHSINHQMRGGIEPARM